MTFLCDNPWIFHRDEVDLLEEEMDEIFRRHRAEPNHSGSQMEDRVLKEQTDLEEIAEAELTLQIGPEYLLSPHDQEFETDDIVERPILNTLKEQAARDGLYQRVYLWAKDVFHFAHQAYQVSGRTDEGLFRTYLTVKMIPIKLMAISTESRIGDAISDQIAKKEFALCLTYFERALDGLKRRSLLADEEAIMLYKQGKMLVQAIKTRGL
ncbi:hypothetical protein HZA85_04085 [Candidatus Uhrbacteria bacterium]|nr:hypothetical protein [Candidatus Uhrbacteria bacterium]